MKQAKRLVLRKENLIELSSETLQRVVAGASIACFGETFYCTRRIDCINDISFEICPTLEVEECLRSEVTCKIVTAG